MAHPFFEGTAFPWHLNEAQELHRALFDSIKLPLRIEQAYSQCGPGLTPLTPGLAADVAWTEALNNLARQGLVRKLCLELEGSPFPAVVAAVQRVRAAVDVVERTVLNDEGLPFLDRKPLRALLEQTARDANALKVIVVRGELGSGRTWTRHLVESVARSRRELAVYYSRGNTFGLDALVSELFDLLGSPKLAPKKKTTTDAAAYHDVCMKLVAAARKSKTRCWLTIDDLDADDKGTPLMDPTIREFFEQFAVDMMNPAVREWFRLVLLAYPAKDPPPTRWMAEHFRTDDTRPDTVAQTDVATHLEGWAARQGRMLPAEEREKIALRVWQEAQTAPASARLRALHAAIESELAKLGGGS